MDSISKKMENSLQKNLTYSYVELLKTGKPIYSKNECDSIYNTNSSASVVNKLLLAEHFSFYEVDSSQMSLLIASFKNLKEKKDTLLINEALYQINKKLSLNEIDSNRINKFLNISEKYIKDSTDKANFLLFKSTFIGNKKKWNQPVNINLLDSLILEGIRFSNSDYQKASLLNTYGNYQSYHLSNHKLSNDYYFEASKLLEPYPYFIYQNRRNSFKLNMGISYFENNEIDLALENFRQTKPQLNNKPYTMVNHLWMSRAFEKINKYDSAYLYFKKMSLLKDTINRPGLITTLLGIEHDYEIKEKQEELFQLSKKKNFFQRNFYFILPLALLFIFLTYLFRMRYKKSDSEKNIIQQEYDASVVEKEHLKTDLDSIGQKIKQLEQERSQTIERLEELKDVVAKDFIILKDKSKVYVEELIYIQSDDHYLKVHLHQKKDNFVRGKLSSIIKQLPPNFKQCHRSYIVNENYISKINSNSLLLNNGVELPISNTYKNNF